jgi:hypothetical protein
MVTYVEAGVNEIAHCSFRFRSIVEAVQPCAILYTSEYKGSPVVGVALPDAVLNRLHAVLISSGIQLHVYLGGVIALEVRGVHRHDARISFSTTPALPPRSKRAFRSRRQAARIFNSVLQTSDLRPVHFKTIGW